MSSNVHISIGGDSSGSIAVGSNINQQHVAALPGPPTTEDWQRLDADFSHVQAQIEQVVAPEQAAAAHERLSELHQAVAAEQPDLSTMEYVCGWFGRNLPDLVGMVNGLIANPVVKAVVSGAGDVAAAEFRRRFPEA